MIVFPLRSWARNTQGLKKGPKFQELFLENSDPSSPSKRKGDAIARFVSQFCSPAKKKKAQNEVQTPVCFFLLSLSLVSCLLSLCRRGKSHSYGLHIAIKNCGSFITTSSFYPLWRFIILAKKEKKSTLFLNFLFMKILWTPTQISFPSKAYSYSTVIAILVDCSLSFLKIIELTYFGDCLKPSFQNSPPRA